ncbi:MAG: SulP family inorganic anion transporter, partial [Bacteroidota bacterium]
MSEEYIQLALLVSLLAGGIQLLLAGIRAGILVNFLSMPVLSGFTSAAALIIITSQLKYFFGIDIDRGSNTFNNIQLFFEKLSATNSLNLIFSISSLTILLLFKKFFRKIPIALILVVISTALVYYLKWDKQLEVIGTIPSGLPSFSSPVILDKEIILKLIPLSIVIAVISFIESMAIAKSIGAKKGEYFINANQELLGLGLSKIIGSFFQAFPNSGSFSRSAINESSGAQSGWSSIMAAIIVGISLLLFTKLFYYIPYALLSAIIIAAVIKLIEIKKAIHLFKTDKGDFLVMIVTFLLTIGLGVQIGIISGIILSLLLIIRKASAPHYAVLGKVDSSGIYKNIKRFSQAEINHDIMIFRYDDDIFFGNTQHFFTTIFEELDKQPQTTHLILDLSSVNNIDSSGIEQIKILLKLLINKGIAVHLANPKGPL